MDFMSKGRGGVSGTVGVATVTGGMDGGGGGGGGCGGWPGWILVCRGEDEAMGDVGMKVSKLLSRASSAV